MNFNLEGDDNNDFSSDGDDNNDLNIINNIEKFKKLECILSNKKKQTAYDYLQYWAIHKYFVYLKIRYIYAEIEKIFYKYHSLYLQIII